MKYLYAMITFEVKRNFMGTHPGNPKWGQTVVCSDFQYKGVWYDHGRIYSPEVADGLTDSELVDLILPETMNAYGRALHKHEARRA